MARVAKVRLNLRGQTLLRPPSPQPTDDDTAALRLRHDQLTRTYIPAVERERDRALSEVENLRQHVSGLQQFQQNLTSHGLTPDEATIGLQMAAAYKANPTAFITNIIRNAQANGVEVPNNVPTPGLGCQHALKDHRPTTGPTPRTHPGSASGAGDSESAHRSTSQGSTVSTLTRGYMSSHSQPSSTTRRV
jgi:hypothetical protein